MRRAIVLLALAASCTRPAREAPAPASAAASTFIPLFPDDPRLSVPSPLADVAHVGSARCQPCHAAEHEEWAASSHATTLRTATVEDEDLLASLIPCSDMTVTHVLGDRHEVRFLVERPDAAWGAGRFLALPCAWNPHEKSMTTHHEGDWRELPFETSCAGCHVTGFARDQSFLEPGVGCEECHGPGGRHVTEPSRATIVGFRGTARDEVTICASCHLQDAVSQRTGRKVPDGYVPGGSLLDDFRFDWSVLDHPDPALAIDVHQKLLIRAVLMDDNPSLRCTSCHEVHGFTHEKHRKLVREPLCETCHQPDMSLKEYRQSCNTCEF